MKHTEIERKWLIQGFPDLEGEQISYMEQGYLSLQNPNVRIRRVSEGTKENYWITIKGKGSLIRPEVEIEIDKGRYDTLCSMLELPPVRKEHRRYPLPGGLVLECNLVDKDEPGSFYYAEVEFETLEQANNFVPLEFLGEEVTQSPGWTMAAYYKRKLDALAD